MGLVQRITKWLGREATEVKEEAEGGRVVARPGGAETEVSTNAQGSGASGEPWPGRDDG